MWVTWAVLLTAVFAAPSCTYGLAKFVPHRMEPDAQRVLDGMAEEQSRAYRSRIRSPRGFMQQNPEPPPPPAPALVGTGGLAALCTEAGPQARAMARECGALKQAVWAEKASLIALGGGVLLILLTVGAERLARGTRRMQRWALVGGWGAVRWVATAQYVANTVLGLWSLYWGAVLLFGFQPGAFSAVFAGMVCIVALAYVLALHRHETLQLRVWFHQAEVLDQDDAPELFTHLGLLAERVGGVPPDKVIVGLAPGLYLAEDVARWGGDPVPGRSLYCHLELLKRLDRDEFDALMLHELAHVAPGASEHVRSLHHPRKHLEQVRMSLNPEAFLSPANALMQGYCDGVLGGVNLRRHRAEQRADALAATLTSPETLARALVKATALQAFDEWTRDDNADRILASGSAPSLSRALREGFEDYSRSRQVVRDVRVQALSHPLDVHAPLGERLAALGESSLLEHLPLRFFDAARSSWFAALRRGAAIERTLWREREQEETEEVAQAS